jgi:hypothetical protein
MYVKNESKQDMETVMNIRFAREVENHVKRFAVSYIDAVIAVCERYGIEPQVAAKFLSKPIIEKIKAEGQELNLLPKNTKLPV